MVSMKDLSFTQYSRLEVTRDSIKDGAFEKFLIGYYKDGSQTEFGITFYKINEDIIVKLEAGSSSWELLNNCSQLLEELSKMSGGDIKAQDIYLLLARLGLRDITDSLNNLSLKS